ncbi:MAG: class I SAM-dependent methyltransferase [Brevinematales bacterium]|nr:class I SAM-dependent methyltransferase [Brevinematales bacterium]
MFDRIKLNHWNDSAENGNPAAIMDVLGDLKGLSIGDIGSGGGYLAMKFAGAAGTEGKVYAMDVEPSNLKYVAGQAKKNGYTNIETVLIEGADIPLKEESIDLFFSRNSYHHIGSPVGYFANMRRFLKPGGRLVIIDHLGTSKKAIVQVHGHFTSSETIRENMEQAGFRYIKSYDMLEDQSFNVFIKD